MHEVFGDVVLSRLEGGQIQIEALGLQVQPLLLPPASGGPLPEIPESMLGIPVSFIGLLPTAPAFTDKGNIAKPCIHFQDTWTDTSARPAGPSFLYATAVGNLGDKPEFNPGGDRVIGSLAINASNGETAWLSLQAYTHTSIHQPMTLLEKGDRIAAYGHLETFTYKGADRTRLTVRGFQRLTFSAKPQVNSISAARPADTLATADSVF